MFKQWTFCFFCNWTYGSESPVYKFPTLQISLEANIYSKYLKAQFYYNNPNFNNKEEKKERNLLLINDYIYTYTYICVYMYIYVYIYTHICKPVAKTKKKNIYMDTYIPAVDHCLFPHRECLQSRASSLYPSNTFSREVGMYQFWEV